VVSWSTPNTYRKVGVRRGTATSSSTGAGTTSLHDTPKGSRSLLVALIEPCDFSDPRAAATFHALQELTGRGDHVDEITVLWQSTRNKSDWGPGLEQTQLTRDCFTGELDLRDIQTVTDAAERRALAKAGVTVTSEAQNVTTELGTTTARVSKSLNEILRVSRRLTPLP